MKLKLGFVGVEQRKVVGSPTDPAARPMTFEPLGWSRNFWLRPLEIHLSFSTSFFAARVAVPGAQ
jgi:hypothetical protein